MSHPAPLVLKDRYELCELLGRGGMAEVYRGVDLLLGRDVAVKVMQPTSGGDVDRARFASEMRLLASLNHPQLVTLLDAGMEAGGATRPWLVMELVTGPTLAHRLAEGPLPAGEVAAIGADLASALAHVHAGGIVHRDVKPANVLLTPAGSAKLADFGVARLRDEQSELTGVGNTIGTAAYLAPEQVSGKPVTGATDIYSLGLVLLEALTGRRAYTGPPVEAALARLHQGPLIPVSLGAGWVHLLDAMLASDPAVRPGGDEVASRLTALRHAPAALVPLETEPVGTGPVEVAATTTRAVALPASAQRTRRRPALIAAAAAAVVILTVGLAWISAGGADPAAPPAGAAELSSTADRPTKQPTRPSPSTKPSTSAPSTPVTTRAQNDGERRQHVARRSVRSTSQEVRRDDDKGGHRSHQPSQGAQHGKGDTKGHKKGHKKGQGKGHGRGR